MSVVGSYKEGVGSGLTIVDDIAKPRVHKIVDYKIETLQSYHPHSFVELKFPFFYFEKKKYRENLGMLFYDWVNMKGGQIFFCQFNTRWIFYL